ncbi:MAG: aminoglycoside 3'-phosphotransferase [Defluviitaleaceae bacterium]|nr:aminoglycoside 3'-phosphotransferase [Defluviitaleaceae bacterium]MCL2836557.1 aminoglycoside 3'-phosphotransferase [Defluviitaleaceae bacterium]
MTLTRIKPNIEAFPADLRAYLDAELFDSSCSPEARVIFINKDAGFFLKSMPKGRLEREAAMTRYFRGKGLAANVLAYISDERDWLLTSKIHGDDGIAPKHLEHPERLCDIFAEQLALLHSMDFTDCPANHTEQYLTGAAENKRNGTYDKSRFPDRRGYASEEEAWTIVENHGHLLKTDTLLHGDYCLPNVILNDWRFSGFIDLGRGGAGDRHIDLFWAAWTLAWNLKTHKYRERFFDAYGRGKVDEDMLRVVAAVEVFR